MTWTPKNLIDDINWDERHSMLAKLISSKMSIVYDFGCGKQNLKKFLRPSILYKGFDKHLYSSENILIDFNTPYTDYIKIENPQYAAVVFEGILEYLNDPLACVVSTAIKLRPSQIIITIHPQDTLKLIDNALKHIKKIFQPETTYMKKNVPTMKLITSLYSCDYCLVNVLENADTLYFSFQRL